MNQIFLSLQQRKQSFIENRHNETETIEIGHEMNNHLLYIRNCSKCQISVTCQKLEKVLIEKCTDVQLVINCGIRTSTIEMFSSNNVQLQFPSQSSTNVQLIAIDQCHDSRLIIQDESLCPNLSIVHSNSSLLFVNEAELLLSSPIDDSNVNAAVAAVNLIPVEPTSQVIGTKQYKSYWNENGVLVTELILREGAHGYLTTKSEVEKRTAAHPC